MSTSTLTRRIERWTANREVKSLGTNDGAEPIAFQRWHHFKEAFAPELIVRAIQTVEGSVTTCLDPFGGSGTTALACQMMGVRSTTVEVNPYLADVIRAKLATYDSDSLVERLRAVRRAFRTLSVNAITYWPDLPPTFVEPGVNDRWIFDSEVAGALASLLTAIDRSVPDEAERRLFRVIVGGMLTEISNVVVSGKGRRYRRNWEARAISREDVTRAFSTRAESALLDIIAFRDRPKVAATVIEGDARTVRLRGRFDLAVFSPPYPNSFDYTDVYNLQLWVLNYLTGSEENKKLRRDTLTSHVQVSRAFADSPHGSETLQAVVAALKGERSQLWSSHLPEMVGAYFHDLYEVTESVLTALKPGGQCWMVVGDSRYGSTHIPVTRILQELLEYNGIEDVSAEPIRHMRTSAQQGFDSSLAESLIRVTRPQSLL